MKIIITKRFEKIFLRPLSRYFTKYDLVKNFKNKEHTFISLHHPFLKLKSKINLVSFRGLLAIEANKSIIPLFIFLKKDKIYGENISWKNHKKLIESEFELHIKDIKNGDFEILG